MYAFPIGYIAAIGNRDNVGKTHAQVLAYRLIHPYRGIVAGFIGQYDTDGITSFLTLDEDGIATEEAQFLHLGRGEGDYRIVIVGSIVDDEAVGTTFLPEDGIFHVGVFCFGGFDHG